MSQRIDGFQDKPFYSDGYPYLLLSVPSIASLNTHLSRSGSALVVEHTRFRPNIFISGDFPGFAEDKWGFIKIGEAVFRNVKLCTRCIYTTIDPHTGEKDAGGEPLKTLRTFRSTEDEAEKVVYGTTPFFGVNLGVEETGVIRVGDKISIG